MNATAVAPTIPNGPAMPQRASLLVAMAAKYSLEPDKFLQTVKGTIFDAKASQEELIAFLTVANRYNLDPFCGEVFAFRKQGGGIQAIVGVDGWSSIINSRPQMDGMEFEDHLDDKGELVAVTCKIYRKDRSHPVTCTEYMVECKRNTVPWRQWPRRMLRHKATIQCARLAFGLTGIVDHDEAERFEAVGAVAGTKVQPSRLNDMLAAMPTAEPRRPETIDVDASPNDDDAQEAPSDAPWQDGFAAALRAATTLREVQALVDGHCGEESKLDQDDLDWCHARAEERKAEIRVGKGGKQGQLIDTAPNAGA